MINAAIGLGANLGDPKKQVLEAMQRIANHDGITQLEASRLYVTEPVGPIQDQPVFINAAMTIQTRLSARELFDILKALEQAMGRSVSAVRFGPRVIDCDILLFGDDCVQELTLTIPHACLEERAFVLYPLREIANDWCLPDGRSIALLASLCDPQGVDVLEEEVVCE